MREKKLIQFYLTNRCNSRCKTCPIWKCKEKEDLKLECVKEFILANKDADFVYGGGEFFLYPFYNELLEWSEYNDINYTILTNGIMSESIKQTISKYIPNVTISWDGTKHDEIRGIPGNSEKIKELVKYIRAAGGKVKLSYTFSKFNYDTIDEDMKVAKEVYGMDKLYLALGRDSDTFSNKDELVAPKDFKPLLKHLNMFYERDVLFLRDWETCVDEFEGCMLPKCKSVADVITVYSNGDIPLCQGMRSDVIWGNIYEMSQKDLSEKIKQLKPVNCKYNNDCFSLCQRRYDYEV